MKTRSMLEIMLEFAAAVQVPGAGVADGKASPGSISSQPASFSGPPIGILAAAPRSLSALGNTALRDWVS